MRHVLKQRSRNEEGNRRCEQDVMLDVAAHTSEGIPCAHGDRTVTHVTVKHTTMKQLTTLIVPVLGLAGILSPATGAETASPARRPNFVFFMVDDLRYDAMSCAGHPFVKTPNIDRLATGGVRFTNAFVTLSLCAPSRAAIMTGAYGHVNGVRTNEKEEFDPKAFATFPMLLQQAGYETAFVGKWHMKPTDMPRPGFDYWLSFVGQGQYIDPKLNENGRQFQAKGYMTDLLTDRAVDWLKRERQKPFCICVWHKAVHGPFTPAERHKGLYTDAELPEPASFRDTLAGKPAWQRAQLSSKRPDGTTLPAGARRRQQRNAASGGAAGRTQPIPDAIPPAKWNGRGEGMLNYYRAEAAVDESVGRVLETLKETGQLDDTYVLFIGDNGYFHGEHRRGDKRLAYEESIRIPFVMRGPGIKKTGSLVDQMVLNIDIGPTILELAGAKLAPTMQGRSFKPLLAGESPQWRTEFLFEYYKEAWLPAIPTLHGVRTTDWKYVTYPEIDDIDELYDLAKDPHEMKNLALDPAYKDKIEEMKGRLARLKHETGLK